MAEDVDLRRIICFDTETTGLGNDAEILQLSIINGAAEVLFDELIRPKYQKSWPQAEQVHHISPEMVADKDCLEVHIPAIMEILEAAQYYVGYNILYDIRMMKQGGISMKPFHRNHCQVIDVMRNFAPIYGDWNPARNSYRWQNLSKCADHYHYDWGTDQAHGALADAKATLYCFKKMNGLG